MPKKLLQNRHFLVMLLVLSLGIFIFGVYGLWQYRQQTTSNAPPTATATAADPSEEAIDPAAEYNVPAGHPRRIALPTINASGFVQQVGVDKAGNVAAPTNINLAGWFKNKARPGDPGVSLIDGHVSGKRHPGIFKNLEKLQAGDRFEIEFGDLSKRQFEVVSVKTYRVEDAGEHMLAQTPDIEKQLNLITCGGRFNRDSGQYENRVLVVSKRIE